jgi:hypothetical protein
MANDRPRSWCSLNPTELFTHQEVCVCGASVYRDRDEKTTLVSTSGQTTQIREEDSRDAASFATRAAAVVKLHLSVFEEASRAEGEGQRLDRYLSIQIAIMEKERLNVRLASPFMLLSLKGIVLQTVHVI